MTPIDDRHYAIPLVQPLNGWLGVAEGIETALSAAIDSGKLVHYAQPPGVHTLFVFADDEPAGRQGTESLRMRLQIERPEMVPAWSGTIYTGWGPARQTPNTLPRHVPDAIARCLL